MMFLVLTLLFVTTILSNAETVPVVNVDNSTRQLMVDDAVLIYTGKITQWPNGDNITLIVLPREHPISRQFIMDHLQITPTQFYDSVNNSIAFRKNTTVIRATTEEEVIKLVKKYQGSIGYTSSFVYYNHRNEVRQLSIKN